MGRRSRLWMNSSGRRETRSREEPSHFGSYSKPPPAGSSSAGLASIARLADRLEIPTCADEEYCRYSTRLPR